MLVVTLTLFFSLLSAFAAVLPVSHIFVVEATEAVTLFCLCRI